MALFAPLYEHVQITAMEKWNSNGLGARPEDVADNVRMILERLSKADPHMPVIVCKVMPSDPSKFYSDGFGRGFNPPGRIPPG